MKEQAIQYLAMDVHLATVVAYRTRAVRSRWRNACNSVGRSRACQLHTRVRRLMLRSKKQHTTHVEGSRYDQTLLAL